MTCRFQPSPFFVLDEIDAALDAVNVARIASYIRSCTRGGASDSFQVQRQTCQCVHDSKQQDAAFRQCLVPDAMSVIFQQGLALG